MRLNKPLFHVIHNLFLKNSDLNQIVFFKDLLGYPQHLGVESHGSNPPTTAIPPVVHLPGGLEDMSPPHRDAAGKSGNPTASLGLGLETPSGREIFQ